MTEIVSVADEDPTNPGIGVEKSARERQLAGLRPARPGEVRNKLGTNGWKKAQARIAKFLSEVADDGDGKDSRLRCILLTAYESARIPGTKGAFDRKLLIEQVAGKARQQVELSGEVGGGGVMLVPVVGGVEAWETAAQAAQNALKEDVRK